MHLFLGNIKDVRSTFSKYRFSPAALSLHFGDYRRFSTSRWACLKESSIRQDVCFPNRCVCFLKPSFYFVLQGAHGLKGNEGPHGPPGPAVSTIYCIRIPSLSPSFSRSRSHLHSLHSKVPTLSCSRLLHNIMRCTVCYLHKRGLTYLVDVPDVRIWFQCLISFVQLL